VGVAADSSKEKETVSSRVTAVIWALSVGTLSPMVTSGITFGLGCWTPQPVGWAAL
jgi:hypothetical protein